MPCLTSVGVAQPNATDDEVAAVVNGDRDVQIFAQNAMGNRYANAQGVYREVQERNEGVKQIERTLMELSDLFTDVCLLVYPIILFSMRNFADEHLGGSTR